ncbi:MAG: HD domain-containing protein [Nanoarchaeota archaeon]|nr:HD domain-containing protein [Nanoarchaeota archaeon]
MNDLEKRVIGFAQTFYASSHHGWDHVLRVRNLALHIGAEEGADLEALEIVAYLHDVMRNQEMENKGGFCHAEKGAEIADRFLKSIGYEKREEVVHCIKTHRFHGENIPETLEAKVFYDADKLDSIGAIGIARTYSYNGEKGSPVFAEVPDNYIPQGNTRYHPEHTAVHEYVCKLSKVKDKMLTDTGREIAEQRHAFMQEFFKRLEAEVRGEL